MSDLVTDTAALLGVDPTGLGEQGDPLTVLSELCIDRLLSPAPGPRDVVALSRAVCALQEASLARTRDHVADRARRIAQCERSLGRLRTVGTTTALVERVCDELARGSGLGRVLLSRVDEDLWRPWKVNRQVGSEDWFVSWAEQAMPLADLALETELTVTHRPTLVRGTDGPRLHPIVAAGRSRSFVVAPICQAGRVIGFFHADHGVDGRPCDETDRDVLWAFTEGFAHLYERAALLDRLREQRARVRDTLADVDSALQQLTEAEIELVLAPDDDRSVTRAASTVVRSDEGIALLTPREREILAIIASGATNSEIAVTLVLTVGTVKTHVKHILRKLGATNRSQAIAAYASAQPD